MDNFIEVYKNAFDDSFCNEVINIYNKASELGMTRSRQEIDQVSKVDKEDNATFLLDLPLGHTTKEVSQTFNDVFWNYCYKQYADKYSILNTCDKHTSYAIKIQKTQPGQGYHIWHPETTGRDSSTRLLVWTAYMNDDFEAGETEFLYQQYRYKPSKGDVVIFPAAFTHTHRGNPPIGGDKYIITGWVEY